MKSVGEGIKQYAPNAFVICDHQPARRDGDWALPAYHRPAPKHQVVGMAGVLDSARFKPASSPEKTRRLGEGHPRLARSAATATTWCRSVRHSTVGGAARCRSCVEQGFGGRQDQSWTPSSKRTRGGGGEIVALLKTGSAFYAR